MENNPYKPDVAAEKLRTASQPISVLNDEDELDVIYCDGPTFRSFIRIKWFSDKGTLGLGSKGGADFYGRRKTIRGMDLDSMRLSRPAFPSFSFLMSEGLLLGYLFLFVLPSRDIFRIWFMAILLVILTFILIRLHTVRWLEATLRDDSGETKHFFFHMGGFGWSTIARGNKKMLDYFDTK